MWNSFLNEVQSVLGSTAQSIVHIEDQVEASESSLVEHDTLEDAHDQIETINVESNDVPDGSVEHLHLPEVQTDTTFLLADLQKTLPSITIIQAESDLTSPEIGKHIPPPTPLSRSVDNLDSKSDSFTRPELGKTPTYASPLFLRRNRSENMKPLLSGLLGMRSAPASQSRMWQVDDEHIKITTQENTNESRVSIRQSSSTSSFIRNIQKENNDVELGDQIVAKDACSNLVDSSENVRYRSNSAYDEEFLECETHSHYHSPEMKQSLSEVHLLSSGASTESLPFFTASESPYTHDEGPALEEVPVDPKLPILTQATMPCGLNHSLSQVDINANEKNNIQDDLLEESRITLVERQQDLQHQIMDQGIDVLKVQAEMEKLRLTWQNDVEKAVEERLHPIQATLSETRDRHRAMELDLEESKDNIIRLSSQLKQFEAKDEQIDKLLESLERDLCSSRRENEELRASLTVANAKVASLEGELSSNVQFIESMSLRHTEEVEELKNQHVQEMSKASESIYSLEEQLAKLHASTESIIQTIHACEFLDYQPVNNLEEVKGLLLCLEKEFSAQKAQLSDKNLQIQELESNLDNASATLEEERQHANEMIQNFEREIEVLKATLESAPSQDDIDRQIEEEKTLWQKEADKRETTYQHQIQQLERLHSDLRNEKEVVEREYTCLIEMREQDAQDRAKREEVFSQKSQQWKEKLKEMKSNLNKTKQELEAKNKDFEVLEVSHQKLEAELKSQENLAKEADKANQEMIASLEERLTVLREDLLAKGEELENERESFEATIQHLESRIEKLVSLQSQTSSKASSYTGGFHDELLQMKDRYSTETSSFCQTIQSIRRDLGTKILSLEQENVKLLEEGASLRNSMATLIDQNETLEMTLGQLKTAQEELMMEHMECKAQLKTTSSKLDQTKLQLEQARSAKEAIQIEFADLEQTSTETIQSLQSRASDLEASLKECQDEYKFYQQEAETWKRSSQEAVIGFIHLSRQNSFEADCELSELKLKNAMYETEILSLQQQIQHATGQLSVLQQSIESSTSLIETNMDEKEESWLAKATQLMSQKLEAEDACRRAEAAFLEVESRHESFRQQIVTLQTERDDLIQTVKTYREQKAAIADERDSLVDQITWSSHLQQVFDALKNSPYLDGTIAERTETLLRRTQDSNLRVQLEDLKAEMARRTAELEEVWRSYSQTKVDYERVTAEKELLDQTLEQFRMVSQAEISKLTDSYVQATAKTDEENRTREEAEARLKAVQDTISDWEKLVQDVMKERDEAVSELQRLRTATIPASNNEEMSTGDIQTEDEFHSSGKVKDDQVNIVSAVTQDQDDPPPCLPPKNESIDADSPYSQRLLHSVSQESFQEALTRQKILTEQLAQSLPSFNTLSEPRDSSQKYQKRSLSKALQRLLPSTTSISAFRSRGPISKPNPSTARDVVEKTSTMNRTVHLAVIQDEARIQDLWKGMSELIHSLNKLPQQQSGTSMTSVSSESVAATQIGVPSELETALVTVFGHFQLQHKQLQEVADLLKESHETQSKLTLENGVLTNQLSQYQQDTRLAHEQLNNSSKILRMHQGILSIAQQKLTLCIDFMVRILDMLQDQIGSFLPPVPIPVIPTVDGDIDVWNPVYSFILSSVEHLIRGIKERDSFVADHAQWMVQIKDEHIKSVHEVESALLERNRLVHIQMETLKRMQHFAMSKKSGSHNPRNDGGSRGNRNVTAAAAEGVPGRLVLPATETPNMISSVETSRESSPNVLRRKPVVLTKAVNALLEKNKIDTNNTSQVTIHGGNTSGRNSTYQ